MIDIFVAAQHYNVDDVHGKEVVVVAVVVMLFVDAAATVVVSCIIDK